jgi:intermembrane space import and assembly protein 40
MFQSAARSVPRRLLASRLPLKPSSNRRFLSTAPPAQRSRSWKNSAARWATAIGGIYYYNTSNVFAEQPEGELSQISYLENALMSIIIEAIERLDDRLHQIQESRLPSLDDIAAEKRQRLAAQQAHEAQTTQEAPHAEDDEAAGPTSVEGLEEEADQQGAFNPETGEINWDCPCLGGMAHGPCGEEFKAAFSCFVYSKEEPKGMECIDKFK